MAYSKIKAFNSKFKENENQGLVICGLQFGTDGDNKPHRIANLLDDYQGKKHCFSNFVNYPSKNDFAFQKRITKFFGLWDCCLETDFDKVGAFERSLIGINWLSNGADSMDNENYHSFFQTEHKENFLYHLEVLEPKLLFFFGINMLEALNDERIKPYAENFLGKAKNEPNYITKPFEGKSFRVGFQSFEKCEVVAFPHPTGTIGLSDEYIALFKDDVKPLIENYRKFKGV
ncbi:hypothetical protein [Helicobacter cetorum]|uniref:hypothetical protein n=1 Tax=Helicobacter cetorum TaxID=138563 RepID=UPI000CF08522|nr:hypothetical protein [Helicobacter cetorum]